MFTAEKRPPFVYQSQVVCFATEKYLLPVEKFTNNKFRARTDKFSLLITITYIG
jgi:hypothetical protein